MAILININATKKKKKAVSSILTLGKSSSPADHLPTYSTWPVMYIHIPTSLPYSTMCFS